MKPDDESQDPTKSSKGNNVDDLLDNNAGSIKLMMGVLMQGPHAIMSEDTLKAFNILAAGKGRLDAEKSFPDTGFSGDTWEPSVPQHGAEQWDTVHHKWASPEWNEDEEHEKGEADVQKTFVDTWADISKWGDALSRLAKIPKLLDKRFNDLYAPLITK